LRADPKIKKLPLSKEEWRARRAARRAKQREANIDRAAKMHKARLMFEKENFPRPRKKVSPRGRKLHIGCSGWFYWKWRGLFYPQDLPTKGWFAHYAQRFDTVEINASFYSWPTVANVKAWTRQPGAHPFIYTIKVSELITHIKKLKGTKTLIKDFGLIADLLGEQMGCFLFQFPASYRFTKGRLAALTAQLDPARRNVVEFRHGSWWNEEVYDAFRQTGTIFCSCSGPKLPDVLIKTADTIYIRLHGPQRWYRHDYSAQEIEKWARRIKRSRAKEVFVYFNNDYEGNAPRNASSLRVLLENGSLAGTSKITREHRATSS
jgi:uncharacterized protein YecE (DUF72 family)